MENTLDGTTDLFETDEKDRCEADVDRLIEGVNRAHRQHVLSLDPQEACLFLPQLRLGTLSS